MDRTTSDGRYIITRAYVLDATAFSTERERERESAYESRMSHILEYLPSSVLISIERAYSCLKKTRIHKLANHNNSGVLSHMKKDTLLREGLTGRIFV